MKSKHFFTIVLGIIILFSTTACKSEFEKIRASGDAASMYKKAFEYYENGDYQKAQTLFELVISSYRGKKEAEELYFRYADSYFKLGSYILASYYFKNFSQTYSTSQYREEADFMAAFANYKLSPTFRLDQTYTGQAIEGFQLFVNTYPESERVRQCNQLIDEMRKKLEDKAFDEAKLYFDIKQYQSATHSFENLLKDFPETANAERVRYLIIRATYLLSENSVVDKQAARYQETIDKASEFIDRYTSSQFIKEVSTISNNSKKKLNQISNVRHQNQSARAGS